MHAVARRHLPQSARRRPDRQRGSIKLNKEMKRRADVLGIFPNEDSIDRLIGAVLLEHNDEWQLQHRYMQIEGMAELNTPQIEEVPTRYRSGKKPWMPRVDSNHD